LLLVRRRVPAHGAAVVGRMARRAARLPAAGAPLLDAAAAELHRPGHGFLPGPADGRERFDAARPARARVRDRGVRRAGLPRAHPRLPDSRADAARAGRHDPGHVRDDDAEPSAGRGLPGVLLLRLARHHRDPVGPGELDPLPAGGAPPPRGRALMIVVGQALRDQQRELTVFRNRLMLSGLFIVVAFAVLLVRFSWLQVVQSTYYHTLAEANRISVVPVVPNRGIILDRNGTVLAANYSAYTLEVTPSKVGNLERAIDDLATVMDVSPRDRRRFKKLQEESKNFE